MKAGTTQKKRGYDYAFMIQRLLIVFSVIIAFIPAFNPVRISEKLVGDKISLFTSALSPSSLTANAGRALYKGWIGTSVFVMLYIGAILAIIGICITIVNGCMSLGNVTMKKKGMKFGVIGAVVEGIGYLVIARAYNALKSTVVADKIDHVLPKFPDAAYALVVFSVVLLLASLIIWACIPNSNEEMEMESKYKLFLMFMPFAALAFVFCYLPLWGWRYAFFDYQSGGTLSTDNFVGFKWFGYLFSNAATRSDVIRVLRNTLAMSFLGVITQWLPMAFAIFLCEIKNLTFRRFVQTFTTIPNFISWILVYAIALSIFSTDGFINTLLTSLGVYSNVEEGKNYLMSNSFIWVKMWAWGTWKGIGWSAIIYIAGISGIDQQLYEAAEIDGAGRFQKMWNVTVPGLLPTFFVLLLMGVAAILSNGLDQYLVFCNPNNKAKIQVLDLYVYNLGLGANGSIPLSTVVGMFKSIVSVALLFAANGASKALRGESII